jgi:molybdopterin-guanine dinucleotide biosynthesis protein A
MLTGIVMCGGKSVRMGTDKGLLLKGDMTWAELAYHKLASLSLPVKVSINASQVESYGKILKEAEIFMDNISIPGPLAGVLSAHRALTESDILILACDMTDISIQTIQELIDVYNISKEKYDFFVFKNGEENEPLLGIYNYKGLEKINQLFVSGELKKFSMKYILEIGNTYSILLDNKRKKEFKNYNEKLE